MSVQDIVGTTFQLNLTTDAEIVSELASLCKIYNLTPQELKFKWEAFALNNGGMTSPTVDLVRQLKHTLQRDFEQSLEPAKARGRVTTKRDVMMDISDYATDMDQDTNADVLENFMSKLTGDAIARERGGVATKQIRTNAPTLLYSQPSQVSSQFAERKATHVIDEQYNGQMGLRGQLQSGHSPASITLAQKPISEYRYMFEKIRDKADGLDDRIEYIASVIDQHYNLEGNFGNPARLNQSTIVAVGRICCDASEGKLNDKSVMLETSRAIGMGKRVKLDLSNVDQYALFPGQIVAVEGVNNTGHTFTVHKILMPPVPSPPQEALSSQAADQPTEVIIAAGPYTLDDDLCFQPLEDLMKMCISTKPDVVLLMGPFISSMHPIIMNGAIDETPEQIFKQQVSNRLGELAKHSPTTRILLMPHSDDLIHEYPLFPQPCLSPQTLGLQHVQNLCNPSTVNINNTLFAIGNINVLFHLGKEEIAKSDTSTDRLGRLSKHLLQQQSFYPLFPATSGDNIDAERWADIQIPLLPDILILPSQLKHFAKKMFCVSIPATYPSANQVAPTRNW
ncbi:DNA polymerase alpha/epsilon subunit B-domain-containing protein [Radiomyces spectabilis]|uniref:DNA polymerase alpha/epsilon subunit B-domain-containing protein n=1 Tax=Radiomyces spectabilis TaxID=64574 RepID=UPI00221E7F7E|nr:DNA polymerase alpha/epsilon subunit B-domain-containing protein [Radiomyces spectabilis]KAI8388386.1 DNA polymerase alpha/epsilon subunit B-domain-containing protein [Radiomyces spectabilis]